MAVPQGEQEYSVPQASAMLGMPTTKVSNALDRELKTLGVTRRARGIRMITSRGLVALELLQAFRSMFQPEARRRFLKAALGTSEESVKFDGCVVVYIAEYLEKVRRGKTKLQRAESLVVSRPEVLSGEPCVKGTRIPVYVVGALARKHGVDLAHEAYPSISREKIELIELYVSANPRRGRPPETALSEAKGTAKRGKTKKVRANS